MVIYPNIILFVQKVNDDIKSFLYQLEFDLLCLFTCKRAYVNMCGVRDYDCVKFAKCIACTAFHNTHTEARVYTNVHSNAYVL